MRLKDIRLAIVIPVSNHWELTEACLLYIYRHTHLKPPQINVIVVDDGSTDGTSDNLHGMLKDGRLPESMTYITHEEQQGFARSCNHGIDYALTPALGLFGAGFTHIMLLNNDVEAWDPSWLRTLLKPFEQEERLIVGPDFIDYNSATFVDDEMVPYIGGWCMVFPVELIHEIGVLDETFSPAFYEDVEFCARATAAGYRLLGLGEVGLKHLCGKTVGDGRLNIDSIHVENQPKFQEKIRSIRQQQQEEQVRAFEGTKWAFYCPGNMYFDDTYLEGEGLGGAESALVQFTRTLALLGADVWVFNAVPSPRRFHRQFMRGVTYTNLLDSVSFQMWDAFVLFRVTAPVSLWSEVRAKAKLFWSCDQFTTMDWRDNVFPWVDRIVAISEHHRQFLIDRWGACPQRVVALPLGITREDFETPLEKIPGRLIYCSQPDRGLEHLPEIYRELKQRVPEVSLTITCDRTLWGETQAGTAPYAALFEGLEDVRFLGKVPRVQLIQEMKQAEIHIYPCDYEVQIPYTDAKVEGENFCLASLECQAAGTPTIGAMNGALRTTVAQGDSGYLISFDKPGSPEFKERIVAVVADLLTAHRPELAQMSAYARRRALREFSWRHLADQWLALVREIPERRKMRPCRNCEKTH